MSDVGGGTGGENDSESSLPPFRPFTREELAIIEKRIHDKAAAAKKRAERRARNIAVRLITTSYVKEIINFIQFARNSAILLELVSFMSRILILMMTTKSWSLIQNWSKVRNLHFSPIFLPTHSIRLCSNVRQM